MTILTRERLDRRYEAWHLHDVEGKTYDEVAEIQGRPRNQVCEDTLSYRRSELTPEERAKYEKKACHKPRMMRYDRVLLCERCQIIRDEGRIAGCDNWNADVLCDYCHQELVDGVRYQDDLPADRIAELGYRVTVEEMVA